MPKKRSPRNKKATKSNPSWLSRSFGWIPWLKFFLLSFSLLLGYCLYLDQFVKKQFEGKRSSFPARVYARPLELYTGEGLRIADFQKELERLNYQLVSRPSSPGEYSFENNRAIIFSRPFDFWDGPRASRRVRIQFSGDEIKSLFDDNSNKPLNLFRLEPVPIGGIYSEKNEDRQFVPIEHIPKHLIETLVAVEDQRFYSHRGIDPRGLLRALFTTATGQGVQGGSTITQQLVKNFFLTPERTLKRKFTEMLMAIVVELRYDKNEILEAYLNEVYFGQDGSRSIHGISLASLFFFGRSVEQLAPHHSALLVGMLKGPAYFNPRRNPERALERRNLVLTQTFNQGFLTKPVYEKAVSQALGVSAEGGAGWSIYPSFLDLVFRQLRRDYEEADLRTQGLRIFTTLDPIVQAAAEQSMISQLAQLQRSKKIELQGASIFCTPNTGEILALVGGRDPKFNGFNRALDAKRQVGSLMKPAIYLTALEQFEKYNLATLLSDEEFTWREPGKVVWHPNNYDKIYHGQVPLWHALADSYNVSSARLGLELGVTNVIGTAKKLGISEPMLPYASTLLGTTEMAPIDIAQMYQTISAGGFKVPLKAIREVLTSEGRPLKRFSLEVKQVSSPESIYLLTKAMQLVVERGTGNPLTQILPSELNIAGKTGTTDDMRDSWFGGFSGNYVGVVWVGSDDNKATGLTGAAGALKVWGNTLRNIPVRPLNPVPPESIVFANTSVENGSRIDSDCQEGVELPFIVSTEPVDEVGCDGEVKTVNKVRGWFDRLFNRD